MALEFRYEFLLAFRYLRSKRSQFVTSLVNVMSVLGVFLGVGSLIVVLALMTGFHDELRTRILGANSHLVMFSQLTGEVGDVNEVLAEVSAIEGVKAAAPFIYRKVMIVNRKRSDGIVLKGIDLGRSLKVMDLSAHIKEGSVDGLVHPPKPLATPKSGASHDAEPESPLSGILLGKDLAANLTAVPGDTIKLVSPFEILTPTGYVPKTRQFIVAGIFQSGMFEYDSSWAYIDLAAAQDFFDMDGRVMGIEMKVADIFKVDEVARRIDEQYGGAFITRSWIQMNGELFSALKLEKLVSFLFLALIVLVASFGMTSSLTLMVLEKRKEIGILKTMGASNASLMLVFLTEGLIIGGIGTILGAVTGGTVCWVLDTFQLVTLPGDVYFITHVPFTMKVMDFVWVCSASMLISLQATFYPALAAARMTPVEALQGE